MARTLMRVTWPAFLSACFLQLVVFGLVDPVELHWAEGRLGWSRQTVYSVGFFVFWLAAAGSSALTLMLGPSNDQAAAAGM